MKTTITKSEYWQLIGMLALAESYYKKIEDIRVAVNDLLDAVEDNETPYNSAYDHVQDELWGEHNGANALLKRIGITVDELSENELSLGEEVTPDATVR